MKYHRIVQAPKGEVQFIEDEIADARQLPFPDEAFDVLYNSYMLDLIPLDDMPVVLSEFHRVLKPNGRLVLVNLSKKKRRQTQLAGTTLSVAPEGIGSLFDGWMPSRVDGAAGQGCWQ